MLNAIAIATFIATIVFSFWLLGALINLYNPYNYDIENWVDGILLFIGLFVMSYFAVIFLKWFVVGLFTFAWLPTI